MSVEAEIEVIVLPYDSAEGASMLARLIAELNSGNWTRFRAAVAFARSSGNDVDLIDALQNFASGGGVVSLTFGADTFAGNAKGSDFDAISEILNVLEPESANVYLYHEQGRTFHPKVYLFDNSDTQQGLLIVGSSNWGEGGLVTNIEANIAVHLDLSKSSHEHIYDRVVECFDDFWSET